MHERTSVLTLRRVGPNPEERYRHHPPAEIRPLIDGRDVLDEVFPSAITGDPREWLSETSPLTATETPRRVQMVEAECTAYCCGAIHTTIRREGPRVIWSDWENTSDDPKELPTFRFDAYQYDAELARAIADGPRLAG
ncbi:hypothetical protein ACFY41_03965 [Streptomyces syringium]|uniref:hypothetical protein n=1 Tax=Streptomyces syringium TaxID=76729 RepID=UPI0036987B2A